MRFLILYTPLLKIILFFCNKLKECEFFQSTRYHEYSLLDRDKMFIKFISLLLLISCNVSSSQAINKKNKFAKLHHQFFVTDDDYRLEIIKNRINKHNQFIEDAEVREYKYKSMASSPYSFFRATNHLMYADLESEEIELPKGWDSQWHSSWVIADMHVQNISYWDTKKKLNSGTVYFLDDFDESLVLPVTVDLFRYLVSLELFMDSFNFEVPRLDRLDTLDGFIKTYRKALKRTDKKDLKRSPLKAMREQLKKIKISEVHKKMLDKWTVEINGDRKFNVQNPKIAPVSSSEEKIIRKRWRIWRRKLPQSESKYLDILDIKSRIFSGLGSLGLKRFYILVQGERPHPEDDLIIQLKQQVTSSAAVNNPTLFSKFSHHYPKNEALRNLVAQYSMYGAFFRFQTNLRFNNQYYLVRQMLPYVGSIRPKAFDQIKDLQMHANAAAKTLAIGHLRARSSLQFDTKMFRKKLSRYLENNVKGMIAQSEKYAKTVRKDHLLFSMNIDGVLNESAR